MLHDLNSFGERLHRNAFFATADSYRLRRPLPKGATKFLHSNWKAPRNSRVSSYLQFTRELLVRDYEPAPLTRNSSWLDRQARAWIRRHAEDLLVIDADKGLGDVVTPKGWVRTELYRLLKQGFDEIPEHEHISRTRNAQDALYSIIKTGLQTDAITDKQARFLSTALVSKRSGRFRLRVKLHKTPIVGRPIANLSRHWLAPASLLLCQALAPIQKNLPFVLTGSHDFVLTGAQGFRAAVPQIANSCANQRMLVHRHIGCALRSARPEGRRRTTLRTASLQ